MEAQQDKEAQRNLSAARLSLDNKTPVPVAASGSSEQEAAALTTPKDTILPLPGTVSDHSTLLADDRCPIDDFQSDGGGCLSLA